MSLNQTTKIGVTGAGTMGTGIAQVAAMNGHQVYLFDAYPEQLKKSESDLNQILHRQVEKDRMTQADVDDILSRVHYVNHMKDYSECGIVFEAIIEDLQTKKDQLARIEAIVSKSALLATNTSSLSIASISSALKKPNRLLGIHFFNPAPLMKLVEIIPGIRTGSEVVTEARAFIDSWGKSTVLAKDTPGFIVNRVARPFYGEALRIFEEGIADHVTIDWAMKELGGFKMGPFELMDLIGLDINYTVTETVFEAFYYDPRFKPSFTQKRYVEAGMLGKKSGAGFYDYRKNGDNPSPKRDPVLGDKIVSRIVVMLINEAADALFMNISSREEIDLAMTQGVNYPKGLLRWADEIGIKTVLSRLQDLQRFYGEDRYRPNPLLIRMADENSSFY